MPNMEAISWRLVGFIWGFDIFWFLVQDACKIGTYKLFEQYYTFKDPDKPLYSGEFLTVRVT